MLSASLNKNPSFIYHSFFVHSTVFHSYFVVITPSKLKCTLKKANKWGTWHLSKSATPQQILFYLFFYNLSLKINFITKPGSVLNLLLKKKMLKCQAVECYLILYLKVYSAVKIQYINIIIPTMIFVFIQLIII